MSSTTIQEQILAYLKTLFLSITTGNGYDMTIHEVKRGTISGIEFDNTPGIVFQAVYETCQTVNYSALVNTMTIMVEAWDEIDGTLYLDKEMGSLHGAIQTAIYNDTQLNGLAQYVKIVRRGNTVNEASIMGCAWVELEIKYVTAAADPTTGK